MASIQTINDEAMPGARTKINGNFSAINTELIAATSGVALKANAASPALTGVPTAPTAAPGTNTTQLATSAFVQAAVAASTTGVSSVNSRTGAVTLTATDVALGSVDNTSDVNKPLSTASTNALALKATIASPTFTGTPAAPTAAPGTNTTQLATTAFVRAAVTTSGAAVVLTFASTTNTDASLGNLFDLTLTGNVILANPTNPTDGQRIRWRIRQDGTGSRTVTLGNKFAIPASAITPLPWSTAASSLDYFEAEYVLTGDKWIVVRLIPGY